MTYDVYFTAEAEAWMMALDDNDYDAIMARVELLEERGPALGRPVVDSIEGSRHPNMKELRAGSMRALFAFDPLRRAIVLVGGDNATTGPAGTSATSPSPTSSSTCLASIRKESR
jgi:hypothetical protein